MEVEEEYNAKINTSMEIYRTLIKLLSECINQKENLSCRPFFPEEEVPLEVD